MSPFPSEHSCRLRAPEEFEPDSLKRITKGNLAVIIGHLKGKSKTTNQAYRYDKSKWTEDEARKHCDEAGGSFEPASVDASDVFATVSSEILMAQAGVEEALLTNVGEAQILRTGVFYHPTYGELAITEQMMDNMVRNFGVVTPKPPTRMVVDYEHQSTMAGELAPAAGWVIGIERRGVGLFAVVDWCERAAAMIRSGEYKFMSPQFAMDYIDKESNESVGPTLMSLALTNRPFLEGMQPLALKFQEACLVFKSDAVAAELAGAVGNNNPKGEEVLMREAILKALDMPAISQDNDVIGAVQKLVDGKATDKDAIVLSQLRIAALEQEMTTMQQAKPVNMVALTEQESLKTKLTETEVKLSEATAKERAAATKLAEHERDARVLKALQSGKIVPAQKAWAETYALTDPSGFDAFVAAAPKVVQLGEKGAGGDDLNDVTLTEEDRKIAKSLGLSEDMVRKHKAEQLKK